jgi:hypothetical protein
MTLEETIRALEARVLALESRIKEMEDREREDDLQERSALLAIVARKEKKLGFEPRNKSRSIWPKVDPHYFESDPKR